jgi:hypothetical protein
MSFIDVPLEAVSSNEMKKVQILEFFTYNHDMPIWVKVSDEVSSIPVCFTQDAVSQYVKNFQGRRLTESKHAIFVIGKFRPIFVQIPSGNNRLRFSKEPHIALEASVVEFFGSAIGTIGAPQDIEMNCDVSVWVCELRRMGNSGDVQKRDTQHAEDPLMQGIGLVCLHVEVPPILHDREPERISPDVAPARPLRQSNPTPEYHKRLDNVQQDVLSNVMLPDCIVRSPIHGLLVVEEGRSPDTVTGVDMSPPCALEEISFIKDASPQHCRISGPSASQSEVTPSGVPRVTFQPTIEPKSQTTTQDIEVSKATSLMKALNSSRKVTDVLDNTSQTHKRRCISPTFSSPFAHHKRRKIAIDATLEHGSVQPVKLDDRQSHNIPRTKDGFEDIPLRGDSSSPCMTMGRARDILLRTGRISTLVDEVTKDGSMHIRSDRGILQQSASVKKHKTRLMGYQVDFEDIAMQGDSSSPCMTMGRVRDILLRTGRIRTLGDEVTKDGSIYIMSP